MKAKKRTVLKATGQVNEQEVVDFIEKLSLAYCQGDDRSLEILDRVANKAFFSLFHTSFAKKAEAVEVISAMVFGAVNALEVLVVVQLNLVQEVARKRGGWPILFGPHWSDRKRCEDLLGKLEVGRGLGVNLWGKSWSAESSVSHAALHLKFTLDLLREKPESFAEMRRYFQRESGAASCARAETQFKKDMKNLDRLQAMVSKLPLFTKKTYVQWWEGASIWMDMFDPHFEEQKEYDLIKQSLIREYKCLTPARRGANLTPGMLRGAIKRRLRQTFKSIAPNN